MFSLWVTWGYPQRRVAELSLFKRSMHYILARKRSEGLKINSISQSHLVLREKSHVITGDCWSHGSQVHFGVLVSFWCSDVCGSNGLTFGSLSEKDRKKRCHISSALVFSFHCGCMTMHASPEIHEVWMPWKFWPWRNLCLQHSSACNICTSEHSLLHSYIVAISALFCRANTQGLNGAQSWL